MMPLRITLLTMGRYRVVYLRLHAVIEQILLQGIAPLAEDGEDVPDVVTVRARNANQRILHLIYIYRGQFAPRGIGLVETA